MQLVLSVNPFDFTTNDGQQLKGVTIQFADEPTSNQRARGLVLSKLSAPAEALSKFDVVPGYYNIEFGIKPGQGGKAEVKYKDAEFVKPLVLEFDF